LLLSESDLTEKEIHGRFFQYLCESTEDLIIYRWKGWWTKVGKNKSHAHLFRREFDIAEFDLLLPQNEIRLIGYEIKGYSKTRKGYRFPSFAEGIDQALVLLHQGADHVYLVMPEPTDEIRNELSEFCVKYTHVGLYFIRRNGMFLRFRTAPPNPYAVSNERKRKMLLYSLARGTYSEIRRPSWVESLEE